MIYKKPGRRLPLLRRGQGCVRQVSFFSVGLKQPAQRAPRFETEYFASPADNCPKSQTYEVSKTS